MRSDKGRHHDSECPSAPLNIPCGQSDTAMGLDDDMTAAEGLNNMAEMNTASVESFDFA
jgi:hypothetical protein